jgi:hypothetical protein
MRKSIHFSKNGEKKRIEKVAISVIGPFSEVDHK